MTGQTVKTKFVRNENLEAELLGHWQNANAFAKTVFLINASI